MSNHTHLKALFTALHGSLPYTYDEKYATSADQRDTIIISKTSSERNIYITANMPHDDTFEVTLYDDINDDNPAETFQWDPDDQDSTLLDLITYIEKTL